MSHSLPDSLPDQLLDVARDYVALDEAGRAEAASTVYLIGSTRFGDEAWDQAVDYVTSPEQRIGDPGFVGGQQ